MRDNIPDALIAAFERQYDTTWNDPQLRNERMAMRYGWAAAMEAKPCLHQIQEPAPITAMDALREAEAALEVAMARILKEDPGNSICVTSEAKALVAVRAALAATPAEKSNSVEFEGIKTAAPVVLPETVPTPCRSMFATQREYADAMAQHRKNWAEVEAERALLATGKQAKAVERIVIDMKQTAELLDLFGGEATEFTVMQCNGHSGPGLYAYVTEYPEDGASFLGKTDSDATPTPQAQADARDADTFEQRMSDWSQEDAIDAERYRFIVEHKLILSGGTEKFGWPIAPFGVECHRYIDAARAAIAAAKGE